MNNNLSKEIIDLGVKELAEKLTKATAFWEWECSDCGISEKDVDSIIECDECISNNFHCVKCENVECATDNCHEFRCPEGVENCFLHNN